ncbi:MAG TPA: NUDIX hydrolase [Nocardioidaceae bacterium]|nr:NUDIX hydrolase [Nocardioidaceae bacterium]
MSPRVADKGSPVRAAGCVVWRAGGSEPEVLLVHRPRYDDWSFPKGKLDRGETPLSAALREVEEETGLRVRLGPPLPEQHYTISTGEPKVVSYWAARPPTGANIASYRRNAEIDDLTWVPLSLAADALTHSWDSQLLGSFAVAGYDSSPLVVVRHAQARSRKGWRGADSSRPLKVEGKKQAQALVDVLGAYGVTRVISSDAARCVDTVLPYLNSTRVSIRLDPAFSQDKMQRGGMARQVRQAMQSSKRIALCSHRPVLPAIFEVIGIEPISLDPGGVVVVHRDKGKVLSIEQH